MVNFSNFPILNNFKNALPQAERSSGLPYPFSMVQGNLEHDTFQKSTTKNAESVGGAEKTTQAENKWDRKRLEKIYDEVWDSVIKNTPVTQELNIGKPKFIFKEDPDSKGAQAAYNFINNSITCNTNNLEDYYLHATRDKDGNIEKLVSVLNDSASKESFEYDKKDFQNIERIKLTDTEKELYLRGAIAHELRHCIQEHLMASTEGCTEIQRAQYKKIVDDIGKVDLSELDGDLKKQLDFSYSVNYKPKKLLDKDMKLKFSMAKSDKRYLSVKDHLLKDVVDDMQHKGYASSPLEMDANNFAFEYLLRYAKSSPGGKIPNARNEIFLGIVNQFNVDAEYALETMGQYGFRPLIQG